jgi:hypothetical protein
MAQEKNRPSEPVAGTARLMRLSESWRDFPAFSHSLVVKQIECSAHRSLSQDWIRDEPLLVFTFLWLGLEPGRKFQLPLGLSLWYH